MNRRNDWQGLLKMANEELDEYGLSLLIVEPEKGSFNCEIWENGKKVETYAENYYEDELPDLLTDAWHHTKVYYIW